MEANSNEGERGVGVLCAGGEWEAEGSRSVSCFAHSGKRLNDPSHGGGALKQKTGRRFFSKSYPVFEPTSTSNTNGLPAPLFRVNRAAY